MRAVYLAGAMDKVPPEFALSWRRGAGECLKRNGYLVFDPTDGKDLFAKGVHENMYTPEQIVEADLDMIEKVDVVLAEISRTDIPYHGTSMELVYARQAGKEVVIWGGCRSYWVRYHADRVFDTLEDALNYLCGGKSVA